MNNQRMEHSKNSAQININHSSQSCALGDARRQSQDAGMTKDGNGQTFEAQILYLLEWLVSSQKSRCVSEYFLWHKFAIFPRSQPCSTLNIVVGIMELRVKFFAQIFNYNIQYLEDMAVLAVKTLPKVLWTQAAYFN